MSTMTPTLQDIESGTRALMAEHGLTDWTFAWDNAKVRAGACHYRTRRITLSRAIFSYSQAAADDWRDTALHEIAHAKAGSGAGHGSAWRAVARSIGCRATRCHALPTPPRPIRGLCSPGCSATHQRDRFPKPHLRYRCRRCGASVRWHDSRLVNQAVIDTGTAVLADSVLAAPLASVAAEVPPRSTVPESVAAARSAAAKKAWATRRARGAR